MNTRETFLSGGIVPVERALTRPAGLLTLAALLPVTASAAAVLAHFDPTVWLSLPLELRRALSRDALLYTAAALVITAPLAGVVIATAIRQHSRQRSTDLLRGAALLAASATVVTAASATLSVTVFGHADSDALGHVITSHTTMFAVALALGAFGALCGTLLTDTLDAAACSVTVVLIAAGGVLVAGTALNGVPPSVIDVAVTASPLLAITSAAHIDLARMAVPYQMSPLAHLQVQYPSWYVASALYMGVAGICVLTICMTARPWRNEIPYSKGLGS